MKKRQEHRQHSKGALLRAAAILWEERKTIDRTWKRRLWLATAVSFVTGSALGAVIAHALRNFS